jgi:hypothetical protein
MLQLGSVAGFSHKTIFVFGRGQLPAAWDLHRDDAIQLPIASSIDHSKGAAPDDLEKVEPAELRQFVLAPYLRPVSIQMK